MNLPSLLDYSEAVQNPATSFLDPTLRRGRARLNPQQGPTAATGGFAVTFDITSGAQRYAVRCFHKHKQHLRERYEQIAGFVAGASEADFLVSVEYLARGMRIGGETFPIVRMPWVTGSPLHFWLEDNLRDPTAIEAVRQRLAEVVRALRRRGVAHGDLQHGNILVGDRGEVRLVDYDGMYLPSLRTFGSPELGHRNYQHPGRAEHFDESLDVFAAAVVDLSLLALRWHPELWDEFNTGENLIFSAVDFTSPRQSSLFARLLDIRETAADTRRLMTACETAFADAPAVLHSVDVVHRSAVPVRYEPRSGPHVLPAANAAELRRRQGEEITVFGRVKDFKWMSPTFTIVNLGRWQHAGFAIICFGPTGDGLRRMYGEDLAGLVGSWVSITGVIQLYRGKGRPAMTPQIQLPTAKTLHVLTDARLAELRAAGDTGSAAPGRLPPAAGPSITAAPPAEVPDRTAPAVAAEGQAVRAPSAAARPPAPAVPTSAASAPGTSSSSAPSRRPGDDSDERLSRLYGSSGVAKNAPRVAASPTPAASASPGSRRSEAAPGARTSPRPARSNPVSSETVAPQSSGAAADVPSTAASPAPPAAQSGVYRRRAGELSLEVPGRPVSSASADTSPPWHASQPQPGGSIEPPPAAAKRGVIDWIRRRLGL
ncbi:MULTISPECIES: hypothetical protein [Actinoalloteichus]|uniref:Protein kinase family protein n=1 Tax=Actinoalloteichus fjordicus TaxID=1612552 RepID=A0AAC9LH62_9PSEU|nr:MULTISPECIES: hypothetical protein [Actinoalloteichus]APU16697.1 protein kinase family protein [Actinoalloteichus fjordicus]APU22763.1 protein kinase family protein [Actinoalloteichus sp. GBA129-24]